MIVRPGRESVHGDAPSLAVGGGVDPLDKENRAAMRERTMVIVITQ